MKHLLFTSSLFLLLNASCEKALLGTAPENSPISNFEIFWKDYDQHSGIIFPKKINWDSVYQVYRPRVTNSTSEEELWTIFTEMIEVFDDEHTFVEDVVKDKTYVSGSHRIEAAIEGFSKELIEEKYLEERIIIETSPDLSYGKIKEKDIGYIYLGDTDGNHPEQTMDDILKAIGQHQAIIFDVRNNGGGKGDYAIGITRAFVSSDQRVMSEQTRNGANYDDFDKVLWRMNINDGENQYLKPVVVLTDRFSVSGAEHTTLYLKVNDNITHIGDTTAGAFSSTSNRQFLPNGWTYQYPIQMSLDANGVSLDGEGLIPDITIQNTKEDIENQQDKIMERALRYLFETYGIE
ncbi:MAG: S41 family peptidase [Bacteroidota bacterium]